MNSSFSLREKVAEGRMRGLDVSVSYPINPHLKKQKNLILRNSAALTFKLLKHGICVLSLADALCAAVRALRLSWCGDVHMFSKSWIGERSLLTGFGDDETEHRSVTPPTVPGLCEVLGPTAAVR